MGCYWTAAQHPAPVSSALLFDNSALDARIECVLRTRYWKPMYLALICVLEYFDTVNAEFVLGLMHSVKDFCDVKLLQVSALRTVVVDFH